jgi:hypothetical protein
LVTIGDRVPAGLQPLHDEGLHRSLPFGESLANRIDGKTFRKLQSRMKRNYDSADLTFSDPYPGNSDPGPRGQEFWNSFVGVPFRSVQIIGFVYRLGVLPQADYDQIKSGSIVPHTVDRQLLRIAQEIRLWPARETSGEAHFHLGELLPAPGAEVPIPKLIKFRQRYNDERMELMEALDDLIHEVSAERATSEETLRVCARRIARASDDVRMAGRARRIDWVRGAVATTIAAGAAASAAGFQQWQWLLGLLSGYTVNVATAKVGSAWTPGPYSYLHRVDAKLRS